MYEKFSTKIPHLVLIGRLKKKSSLKLQIQFFLSIGIDPARIVTIMGNFSF